MQNQKKPKQHDSKSATQILSTYRQENYIDEEGKVSNFDAAGVNKNIQLGFTTSAGLFSEQASKLNFFESCMQNDQDKILAQIDQLLEESIDVQQSVNVVRKTNGYEEIELLIEDNVSVPLGECCKVIYKTEGPYMPLTMTLYRGIAYRKFKRMMMEKLRSGQVVEIDKMSSLFCRKVDLELLDKQFYPVLVSQYQSKIIKHRLSGADTDKMPVKIRENIEFLKESQGYMRLVQCIAEWFALMEMSEDLIERLKLYGISQYLDEKALVEQLHQNWGVRADESGHVKQTVAAANGYFLDGLASMCTAASDCLFRMGAVSAASATATRYAFGYAVIHPGYFVSALVSSAVVKMAAESLQKQGAVTNIDAIADHFATVTSNLHHQYQLASETVAMSFLDKDQLKIHTAIQDLLQASNKQNQGTMKKFFDSRDSEIEDLKMSYAEDDFVHITKQSI